MITCTVCKKQKPQHTTIKIDGVSHHYCEQCWDAGRKDFVRKLERGDPAATQLYALISRVVGTDKGKKQ